MSYTGVITGPHQFRRLSRTQDVSGISGTGNVAYLVDLFDDGVVQLWDTQVGPNHDIPTHGISWHRSMELVDLIHGHNGATTIEPISHPVSQLRLEYLLGNAVPRLTRVAARFGGGPQVDTGARIDAGPKMDAGPRDGRWFRSGRSNPRNLYLVNGADWKQDVPLGSVYRPAMGTLVVDALNAYCDAHPSLLPRLLPTLVPLPAGEVRR